MIHNVEHLCIHLLAIWMVLFVKCLFKSFALFLFFLDLLFSCFIGTFYTFSLNPLLILGQL